MREIAELIVERWNESPAAVTATNLLIMLALRDESLDDAEQLLAKLPVESRGAASLNLGGALWTRYLQSSANNTGELELAALKTRSGKLLAEGYNSIANRSQVNLSQAAGVLYYLQWLLSEGDSVQALEVLQNPQVGPLALLESQDFADNPAFALEAFKAALRVYISSDPPQEEQAIAMMERMGKLAGSSPQAQQQLTSIYVNLGKQMQNQIETLTAGGKLQQAQGLAAAFSSVLERVADRSDSQSWSVRNWLAETSLQLGTSLQGNASTRHLQQAEQAYRDILSAAENDSGLAPSELALLAVRKKLGECLLAQGNYESAIEQFTAVLSEKPNILELQQATAAAFQAWGTSESNPKILDEAIQGSLPQANGKNLVWGWLQMAKIADSAARKSAGTDSASQAKANKFHDLYFESWYHAAEARLAAAKLATGQDRVAQMNTVRQSIATLEQLYPDMGGPRWKDKFTALSEEAQP